MFTEILRISSVLVIAGCATILGSINAYAGNLHADGKATSCSRLLELMEADGLSLRGDAEERILESRLKADFSQALRLRRLDPVKTISVALGHANQKLSIEQGLNIKGLISQIRDFGYTIIYDADSAAAPLIADSAGVQGVGVSGWAGRKNDDPNRRVVTIENTSLRMDALLFRYNDAFQKGHRLIVSLDSNAGVGLLLQNHPDTFVFDPSHIWRDQPRRWVESLGQKGRDLKLVLPPSLPRIGAHGDLGQIKLKSMERDPALKDLVYGAADEGGLPPGERQLAERYARDILVGENEGIIELRGAAIFCSAIGDSVTNGVLAQISSYLGSAGIPVVTGGSVATMEVVNRAAKEAGGISVGIPIHRSEGHPEFMIPTEAHTHTHLVEAHPARLHFLLEGKEVVFIGPGGKGIIKELGATLVKFAASPDLTTLPKVVLIDRYYEGLHDFISSLPLPAQVRSRFILLPLEEVNERSILKFFNK